MKRAFLFILVLLLAFTFCFSSLSLSEARSASLAELIRQEAKSEVWVEVEGQPYAIITLRHYIDPQTLEKREWSAKVYVDSLYNPVSDPEIARKLSCIDLACSLQNSWVGSPEGIRATIKGIEDRLWYHNLFWWKDLLTDISAKTLATAIKVYLTEGVSLTKDVCKHGRSLLRSFLLDPTRLARWDVYDDFEKAKEEYREALEPAQSPIRDYQTARDYLDYLFSGDAYYYPALHLLNKLDELDKSITLSGELLNLSKKVADELLLGGKLGDIEQVLEGIKTLPEYKEYLKARNRAWAKRDAVLSLLSGAGRYSLALSKRAPFKEDEGKREFTPNYWAGGVQSSMDQYPPAGPGYDRRIGTSEASFYFEAEEDGVLKGKIANVEVVDTMMGPYNDPCNSYSHVFERDRLILNFSGVATKAENGVIEFSGTVSSSEYVQFDQDWKMAVFHDDSITCESGRDSQKDSYTGEGSFKARAYLGTEEPHLEIDWQESLKGTGVASYPIKRLRTTNLVREEAEVSGVVKDKTGKPIPGAEVKVYDSGDKIFPLTQTVADGRGRFNLKTPSGKIIIKTFLPARGLSSEGIEIKVRKGEKVSGLEVSMSPKPHFEIKVEPPFVRAFPGEEINYTLNITSRGNFGDEVELKIEGLFSGWEAELGSARVFPPEEVILRLKIPPETSPGHYIFTVSGEGGGIRAKALFGVEVKGREQFALIKGKVRFQGREDNFGAKVCLGEQETQTSGEGLFSLFSPPGQAKIKISMPGYLPAQRELQLIAGEILNLPEVTLLGGDADENEIVDLKDLKRIATDFNQFCFPPPRTDIDENGITDIFDLVLAGLNLGKKESEWTFSFPERPQALLSSPTCWPPRD